MYDYGIAGVVYASFHIAVLSTVRYWLYKDRLRISLKFMIPILTAITLLGGCAWLYAGRTAGIGVISFDGYRMIMAVLMFALSCFIIKVPVVENAFSYAFILAFNAAVETTAFYVRINFAAETGDLAYPAISALITGAVLIPGTKSLKLMITRLSEMESDKIWSYLDMSCFSFIFMNLLVTLPHPTNMTIFYPVGRYLMLLGMVGIYKASVRIMDSLRTASDARAELMMTQRRIAMQQSYYNRMISQMDEVRRMRHDFRHHKTVLAALAKSGDTEALSEYLGAQDIGEESLPVTGNLAADSVLMYFLDGAKSLGISVETNLSINSETPVSDPDLCVILSNLLENALEAQKYVEPSRRYIHITAKGDKIGLTLAVDNRFDGILKECEDGYLSRKEEGDHGLGISSVKVICEKYGGILQLDTEGDMFMAGVVIGL